MDDNILADDEPQVEAQRAKGLRHELTHLPYRDWCPICVQGRGRQDNYETQRTRQPVIQVDFAYIKTSQDSRPTAVLTAVDVTTQLCVACLVPDKSSMMAYMTNNLQAFVLECSRTNRILQSDNEDTLNTLLKATAARIGSMTVRHSPAYSSNSQGSVEGLHRTLLGPTRTFKAQVDRNYGITLNVKHPVLPWIIRHAAWAINRYVVHSDGYTSFERRWGRNYERAIVEFGETLTLKTTYRNHHRANKRELLQDQYYLQRDLQQDLQVRSYRTHQWLHHRPHADIHQRHQQQHNHYDD